MGQALLIIVQMCSVHFGSDMYRQKEIRERKTCVKQYIQCLDKSKTLGIEYKLRECLESGGK